MIRRAPLLLALAAGCHGAPVASPAAGPEWSPPRNLGPTINTPSSEHRPTLSPDGLSLYFGSNRPGGLGGDKEGTDLYVSHRASLDAPWGAPRDLGPPIDSPFDDNAPSFSPDGRTMYFGTTRPGGCGGVDLWVAERDDPRDDFGWRAPRPLGCALNSPANDDGPTLVDDGAGHVALIFTSTRPGGPGDWDLYESPWRQGAFGPPRLLAELSSPLRDTRSAISADGRELLFTSTRPGGAGKLDIWVARRADFASPWSPPRNLGPPVNDASANGAPTLSRDGLTMYFDSTSPGGFGSRDLYVTSRARR